MQGSLDADRLAHLHVPVVQLNTGNGFGGECHLDANMVRSALPALPLDEHRPADRRERRQPRLPGRVPHRRGRADHGLLGRRGRGQAAEVPADVPRLRARDRQQDRPARRTSTSTWTRSCTTSTRCTPASTHLLVSARTGEGVDEVRDWLARAAGARGSAGVTHGRRRPARTASSAALAERGCEANERFFARRGRAARAAVPPMAERFARGGRLVAFGARRRTWSDVRHVAVEFVHPVIVGKRALPALGLIGAPGEVALLRRARRHRDRVRRRRRRSSAGVAAARRARLPDGRVRAARRRVGAQPPSDDPFVAPGAGRDALPRAVGAGARLLRAPRAARGPHARSRVHDAGASSFLYPFLGEREHDLDAVLADVARVRAGRRPARSARCASRRWPTTARRCAAAAAALRAALRRRRHGCSRSATAARRPTRWTPSPTSPAAGRRSGWPARPRARPHRDTAILTAIANDIGTEAIFARQVIALRARRATCCWRSRRAAARANVLAALAEARRRGAA